MAGGFRSVQSHVTRERVLIDYNNIISIYQELKKPEKVGLVDEYPEMSTLSIYNNYVVSLQYHV